MISMTFPEEFLPAADALAFDPDWVDTFYSDVCSGCHNVGPLDIPDCELEEYVSRLIEKEFLEVVETRLDGNRRIQLTELGGIAWEERRKPNWNLYCDYFESLIEDDGTQQIQIMAIYASVCWKELIDQINFGRIDSDTITKSSFGFEPNASSLYWKSTESGIFRLTVNHRAKPRKDDPYWESRDDWRDSWQ